MNWLEENSALLLPIFTVATLALLVAALVLVVALLVTRRSARNQIFDRVDAEHDLFDLELALAEQTARLRIIRELHDVAAHSISTIISQADGARYAAESDPSAAVRSAAVIADAARTTLGDLRRVMTAVHEGEAATAPLPQQRSVEGLFTEMRDAGLVVRFDEAGEPFDLRPGAELAVYRILQESLSNALKYGGEGTEAHVSFTWTGEGLHVRIDDDGVRAQDRRAGLDPNEVAKQRPYNFVDDLSALTTPVTGSGITEMRQRAALFGGIFNASPVPGVGFSVSAVFPALRYHNGVHGVNLGV